MADDPAAIVAARAALGRHLAALRSAAGYTQETFAPLTFYGRSSIANIERGRQSVTRDFWARCDSILQTGGALAQEHDRLTRTRRDHQPENVASRRKAELEQRQDHVQDTHAAQRDLSLFPEADASLGPDVGQKDVLDVLARLHNLSRTIDPAIIDQLRYGIHNTLDLYDTAHHAQLTTSLVKQRTWLDTLLSEYGHPRQREQLFEIAAMTSGLLGYLAVGRARFRLARAYCLEAFRLAEFAQDANLQAWTRGIQSFCEYYAGDYRTALQLAMDGLAYARLEPQSVRLTINGVARAAGKLQNADGVHRAVDKAYELMAHHQAPAGVPSSIALGCYSPAQVASNAATAYVALGMSQEAQHYVDLAMPDISRSNSPWSRSLVMIDLGTSLIKSNDNDLDHACGLVLDALSISHDRPIVSVQQRAVEFLRDATARWGKDRHINPVREALATMGSR